MIQDDLRDVARMVDMLAEASRDLGPITLQLRERLDRIEESLGSIEEVHGVRVREIVRTAALLFEQPVRAILGPRRWPPLVRARDAIVYTALEVTDYSYPRLGTLLGGRDHTTILASRRRALKWRQDDKAFCAKTDRMVATFTSKNGKDEPWLL